jgi:hypothetical protein
MSERLSRDKIAAIKRQQATEETVLGKARRAAAKHRSDAASQRAKITPRTSDSMARSYQRAAEAAEKRAAAEDSKVSKHSKKLGQMATDLAASVFSARLYAAIASAQPIGAAVRQGSVAMEFAGTGEGWKPGLLARDDVELDSLVLVKIAPE